MLGRITYFNSAQFAIYNDMNYDYKIAAIME